MASNATPAYGSMGPTCDPDIKPAVKASTNYDVVDKTTLTNYTSLDTFPQDPDSRKAYMSLLYYNPIVGYGYNNKSELTFVYETEYEETEFITQLKTDIINNATTQPSNASSYYADPIIPGSTTITNVPSGTFYL
jgi:hypothetical protein